MLDDVQITEEGLFIPQTVYQNFGEIEIVRHKNYILIKPKDVTLQFSGFIRPALKIEEIGAEYDLSLPTGDD